MGNFIKKKLFLVLSGKSEIRFNDLKQIKPSEECEFLVKIFKCT